MANKQPSGMAAFTVVWIGQAISLLGTAMSGFALTLWAYQETQSATALALVGFFFITPMLVISPVAGALVDRSNRKLMMMISDLAAGLATIAIFILMATGRLEIWHLYVSSFVSGTFQAFQWPAYSAAITMIVPKKHYARAHALNELAGNTSGIFAPLLAGTLIAIPWVGIEGILMIDIVTFIFAIGALLFVHIPNPETSAEGEASKGSLLKESAFGFKYIFARPSLLGLQLVFLVGNFFASLGHPLIAPTILARTNNNALMFGGVETAGAIGGVLGGLFMGAWGGTKRKVHGVLTGWALSGLFGFIVFGLSETFAFWAAGTFMGAFLIPLINSSNQAIWQSKVPPDLQGRVFAIRRLIAWFVNPLALLIVGPLADRVLEPAMQAGKPMAQFFAPAIGSGPGAGMSLIIVFAGVIMIVVGLSGYLIPAIRDAEAILPDHKLAAESERESEAAPGTAEGALEEAAPTG